MVLELVGERASKLDLKDRFLGLDEAAELGRKGDLFDERSAAFVEPRGCFFEPVAGGGV
jgi:hypothetical protein